MPLYDKNLSVYVFLENPQKPPSGFECAARRRMNINPILGFFVMNRLMARVAPPGDVNTVQKRYFSYFSCSRICWAQFWYRQAPSFDFLGARRYKFFLFV